ncbi:MAG: hypothetical protein N4A49_13315 [Marinifilaceae bacterium]|jgi:hypothetical protein|nr:hypothetical protein [Marinifilaceae bacterium]
MKTKLYTLISFVFAALAFTSCSKADELTPKTENLEKDEFIEVSLSLTEKDRAEAKARIDEYSAWSEANK